MCVRIITHSMHHDVATPMIVDPLDPNPIIYANPLHTNSHQCELMLPPQTWFPNGVPVTCPFHSCCIPHEEVKYCLSLIAYLDKEGEEKDFRPEECSGFVIEHHHERLPYLGDRSAVECGAVPATWRGLANIKKGVPDWCPNFARGEKERVIWEAVFFSECEKLYMLRSDVATLSAAEAGLRMQCPPRPQNMVSMMQAARGNLSNAEERLHTQKKLLYDLYEWALDSYTPLSSVPEAVQGPRMLLPSALRTLGGANNDA